MFTPEEKQKVREATDLVALVSETVALRQQGRDLWGYCPFHPEKTPSFHVMPDRGFWKCFSCGQSGDCFTYVMQRDHVDFPDAVRILADRAGIHLSDEDAPRRGRSGIAKDRLYAAVDEAVSFYHQQLTRVRSDACDRARAYFAQRGFGSAVAERWSLGYAPGEGALVRHLTECGYSGREMEEANLAVRRSGSLQDRFYDRVIFPIRDERGRAIGMGGRVLGDGKPKYLNTAETPIFHKGSNLFALDVAKASITAHMEVLVMEGYTDVIASHEAGITYAVAPLGTAFRARHVKILSRYLTAAGDRVSRGRIICLFDGDEAGLRAAERALQFVGLTTAGLYCVILPDGKDPADVIAEEGAEAFKAYLADPQPLVRFVIDRHFDRFDITTPEQRAIALSDVVQAIAPIKGTPLADEYTDYIASRLMADPSTVRSALAATHWLAPRDDEDDEPADQVRMMPSSENTVQETVTPSVTLLPGDEQLIRIERQLLSVMAESPLAARTFAERIAQIDWCDPQHEAIAWAILAAPDDASPASVLSAAEEVCPTAAQILADGSFEGGTEGVAPSRTLEFLLDDLEMRTLRRRIEQGRLSLRGMDGTDTEAYDALFSEVSDLQRRLKELETKMRSVT